jgi:hypothetical protein
VTVEMPGSGVPLSVAFNAWYDPDDEQSAGLGTVGVEWAYEAKQFDVGEILVNSDPEMRFVTTAGRTITVRPTVPPATRPSRTSPPRRTPRPWM